MKEKILEIRSKYPYYGKDKIKEILERDYKILISASTIGRYLKKKGLVYEWRKIESACKFKKTVKKRKNNKKRLKDFLNPKDIIKVGQVIQIDTVRIMYNGESIYVINAIDVYSKLAISYAYNSPSSKNAKDFLENKLRLFFPSYKTIEFIQTDNGSEFMKYFDKSCNDLGIKHVWNYPKSPKMNSYIERFNGTIQIECLEKRDALKPVYLVNKKIRKYLIEYNSFRPHKSLGYLTPMDFYISSLQVQFDSSLENISMHNMLWTHTEFFKNIFQKCFFSYNQFERIFFFFKNLDNNLDF